MHTRHEPITTELPKLMTDITKMPVPITDYDPLASGLDHQSAVRYRPELNLITTPEARFHLAAIPINPDHDHALWDFDEELNRPLIIELEQQEGFSHGPEYVLKIRQMWGISIPFIKAELHGRILTIHGERIVRKTGRHTLFSRSLLLPYWINLNEIDGSYDADNILHLHLPIKPEIIQNPRTIAIDTSIAVLPGLEQFVNTYRDMNPHHHRNRPIGPEATGLPVESAGYSEEQKRVMLGQEKLLANSLIESISLEPARIVDIHH